jgi:peptide/nickel transport system permease protein
MMDPARVWAGLKASPATIEAIRIRYHLNDPLLSQFAFYLTQLLHFDLGTSPIDGSPILSNIAAYLPNTIELALVSIVMDALIGIPLGVYAAAHAGKRKDDVVRVLTLLGSSTPPFLIALIFLLVFFFGLRIAPSGGQLSVLIDSPPRVTGMMLVDSLLALRLDAFVDALWHIILPALALSLTTFGLIARLTRTSMLEVLGQDYVRTARAKGLEESVVINRHALRNALIPTVTVLGLLLGDLLSGTIVVETVFSWPGIGRYATTSVSNADFPAIMGVTIVFTLAVVISNLLADITYAVLDPRIRLE